MSKQVARVIVASEYPKMRYRLKELVEDEPGAVVIGQAENASRALALARKLRPDFAIIDSYLPHVIGLDAVPLSRVGGLDTAQIISEEIPHVRVILLTNMEGGIPLGSSLGQDLALSFTRKELEASVPLKLRELYCDTVKPCPLVFANVEPIPLASAQEKSASLSGTAIFLGSLGILVGLGLIATMFLATAGAFIALAGGLTMFLGIAGKLMSSFRSRPHRKQKNR